MKVCLRRTPGLLSPLFALFIAVFLSAPGCEKETDVGGPGAVGGRGGDDEKGPNTFNLTLPSGNVDIEQGESKEVTIGFEPGENFKQSVKVKTTAPENITVEPAEQEFQGEVKEITVNIAVSPQARVGEHKVIVIGEPSEGENSEGGILVNVTAKDE